MIKVYPNPTNSNFLIELHKKVKPPVQIIIVNNQGKEIHKISDINERKINILYPLDSGLYYIILKDRKNKIFNQKIINLN